MSAQWIDVVGYVATALVAGSSVASRMMTLRSLNLVGSSMFVCYGVVTQAYPIVLLNSFLAVVNIIHILYLRRQGRA